MEVAEKASVPLPVIVDKWVDEQCAERGISFEDLEREAFEVHPEAEGEGLADRATVALWLLFEERTGVNDGVAVHETGWRRLPQRHTDT